MNFEAQVLQSFKAFTFNNFVTINNMALQAGYLKKIKMWNLTV